MQNIWQIFYNIFKYSIRVLYYIKTTIINIFLLIFIIVGIEIYSNLHQTKLVPIKSALLLDLNGTITDQPVTHNKLQKISQNLLNINKSNIQENSLFEIVNSLRYAIHDQNITGLILSLKNFTGGSPESLEYIGKVLCEFKQSGKPIYAISDHYTQAQYFLASYANKIYITPQGVVNLKGISTEKLYYKTLLDNLKINTHIFRIGTYKSAIEPFTRNNMSHLVRMEEQRWVNQIWNNYLQKISENRKINTHQIFPGINNVLEELHDMQGDTAKYALKKKWIDIIASNSEIENIMKKQFGSNKQGTSFNAISIYDYHHTEKLFPKNDNQIAIICINGIITEGEDTAKTIGSDTVLQKIRDARFNPKIKALVMRVNSPGGSVNASELIRLELMALRYEEKKPIVVSMGGIAASGGYWISTPANSIIANNNTITGSIGVFGIINTLEESLHAIGIHNDGVDTSPIANISITKKLPIEYIKMMQIYVKTNYHYFVDTVATARNKSIEEINKIAQGHIWLGYDAIKNGLIDSIGDFDDAINKAAELTNLTSYQLNWSEDSVRWIDILLQQTHQVFYTFMIKFFNHYILNTNVNYHSINNYLNDNFQHIWNDPKNCYALCVNSIRFN